MRASPNSLDGQLAYILERWKHLLPEALRRQLHVVQGLAREEYWGRGPVEPQSEVLTFDHLAESAGDLEPERFSMDRDWMPRAVLIAKSTYVWLDQLSRKYQRAIKTLDQIPDEELDQLSRWGFTALWLIGLWQRSPASRLIKQKMGNPDALASAYSLYDYVIADDLGGQAALDHLRRRAWERGIRLASDMVPNHTGIVSRWVIEHPDWYLSLDHSPYPNYTFSGPDLCEDDRVSIYLEDGYYDHRDAAVVFKRVDNWTGGVKYIYHGNDGTHLPWNDTAQLNYLNPETREAVIQTILHVARQFPLIRFDAAMTLAKRHLQRLWFPLPGEGGAIPSRAEHGMTRQELDEHIPEEFWREVVNRIPQEAPDAFLLAEAFWMMEGYFVRTLGMHRVYNSAFMNMLKMEDNAEYRMTLKNVLEFSPLILGRFVNFMNNPDERTAVEQFGKDDKYFGVAILMVTLPGLPMFGHGQIEGYTEKYGMEYSRAYWDEPVDQALVERHEREIFPLLRKRYLFSGTENFALFDFVAPEGWVNENVLAYCNRDYGERSLILYNNAYESTSGTIHTSVAMNEGSSEEPRLIRKSLAEALALRTEDQFYYVFRDYRDGRQYLRQGRQLAEEGLSVMLGGYQYHAYLDFREIEDADASWGRLCDRLGGGGVSDIEQARREMLLEPLLDAFRGVFSAERIEELEQTRQGEIEWTVRAMQSIQSSLGILFGETRREGLPEVSPKAVAEAMRCDLETLASLQERLRSLSLQDKIFEYIVSSVPSAKEGRPGVREIPVAWLMLRQLGPAFNAEPGNIDWLDVWLLTPVITGVLGELGEESEEARRDAQIIRAMLGYSHLLTKPRPEEVGEGWRAVFKDPQLKELLSVNRHEGVLWFNKERFETLLDCLFFAAVIMAMNQENDSWAKNLEITDAFKSVEKSRQAAAGGQYQIESTLRLLEGILDQ